MVVRLFAVEVEVVTRFVVSAETEAGAVEAAVLDWECSLQSMLRPQRPKVRILKEVKTAKDASIGDSYGDDVPFGAIHGDRTIEEILEDQAKRGVP